MAELTKAEVNEAIGRRIVQRREALAISRHRLGLMVGASGSMVEAWEEGASPNLYYLIRLCSALKTSPAYILTGKGN